jgi:hypothetical protein
VQVGVPPGVGSGYGGFEVLGGGVREAGKGSGCLGPNRNACVGYSANVVKLRFHSQLHRMMNVECRAEWQALTH